MGVMGKHSGRDVSSNGRNCLVAGLTLCQFGDCVVTEIVDLRPLIGKSFGTGNPASSPLGLVLPKVTVGTPPTQG